jgi:hypothetical protein
MWKTKFHQIQCIFHNNLRWNLHSVIQVIVEITTVTQYRTKLNKNDIKGIGSWMTKTVMEEMRIA